MLKNMVAPVTVAIAALFLQQAWWVRGLTGAVIGASLSIVIPAIIDWATERGNVSNLRADCFVDFLPTKLPAEGRVLVVQLSSNAETPHQAGQSSIKYGDPGMITGWTQGSHAYKCEIRNLGPPIFDVALTFAVDFHDVVQLDPKVHSFHAGELVRSGAVSVIAPRLEEKPPFGFWMVNLSPYFATITGINASFLHPSDKSPRLTVNRNVTDTPRFSPGGL
jgi:hypothetical protein